MNAKLVKLSLIVLAAIILTTTALMIVLTIMYGEKIYPGVKIESLAVSGMTVDEAEKRVARTFKPRGKINLVFKDKENSINLEDIGAQVKARRSAKKALAVGRSEGIFANLGQRYLAWRRGYRVKVAWVSNAKKTRAELKKVAADINQPARDAKLLIDQKNVSIAAHQEGRKLNFNKSLGKFSEAFGRKSRDIKLVVKTWRPEKTTKDIKDLRIEKQLAEFSTSLSPSRNGRRLNIELAMNKIDGTQIGPGETFSFNRIVGHRTSTAGFRTAPVIEGGRLVPGIGGGICQVATTLYNAAMISGVPILDRSVHSFFISSYPTGRDATVVDGQIDFSFRNDTDGTLLIKMFILSNAVGFKIYGPDTGRENIFSDPSVYNYTSFSSKTETDTSLPPGARVVAQSGVSGRTVTVIRKVMANGKRLMSEKIVSRYTPRQEIIKVGPAAPPPQEETSPTPNTTTTVVNE